VAEGTGSLITCPDVSAGSGVNAAPDVLTRSTNSDCSEAGRLISECVIQLVQSGTWVRLGRGSLQPYRRVSLPDCLLMPIFKKQDDQRQPGKCSDDQTSVQFLRFLWCHTVTNSMQKRYRRGKIVAAVVASRTARASAGRNSGWSTEGKRWPHYGNIGRCHSAWADSQPREVTRPGVLGMLGSARRRRGDCAGCADCSICRVRNDGFFSVMPCGRGLQLMGAWGSGAGRRHDRGPPSFWPIATILSSTPQRSATRATDENVPTALAGLPPTGHRHVEPDRAVSGQPDEDGDHPRRPPRSITNPKAPLRCRPSA